MSELTLSINGGRYELDVEVGRVLAEVLRDDLGLTGTKIACFEGHCGACTVQVDGVPTLSCITLAHTVEGREITTIEGLREHPLVDAFVRTDALQCGFCTPGQIVSAAALVEANPNRRDERDPARDGGEPLPLRHVSQDRGGNSHVARLIRTEKEVEGRFEEVWLVVEEDPLDQWPDGPLDVVGRPAPRQDGLQRATGKAHLHRRPRRCRGCCTRPCCARRTPRARVKSFDASRALEAPGVRAVLEPGAIHAARHARRTTRASRSPRSPRTRSRQARAALGAARRRVRAARADARPRGGGRAEAAPRRAAHVRPRRRRARLRGGRRRRRGDVPDADRAAQLDGDAPVGVRLGGRPARRLHLDAVHLGHPRRDRGERSACRGQGARRLQLHGRRLRLEERRRATTRTSRPSSRSARAARSSAR